MQIKYMPIESICPYENNPRNNQEAVKYVAKSIQDFGFRNPIIVDKNNIVVAGHTRLEAAKQLKLDKVPVIEADDLSEEKIKAFRLADNMTGTFSEWDVDLLDEELAKINIDLSYWEMSVENYSDYFSEHEESQTHKSEHKKDETIICPYCGAEVQK